MSDDQKPRLREEARVRPHLIDGEFQSDKYPTTPRGKVPLSVTDPTAQNLLWEYAQRRRVVDAEFADDLEEALRLAGYAHATASTRAGAVAAKAYEGARVAWSTEPITFGRIVELRDADVVVRDDEDGREHRIEPRWIAQGRLRRLSERASDDGSHATAQRFYIVTHEGEERGPFGTHQEAAADLRSAKGEWIVARSNECSVEISDEALEARVFVLDAVCHWLAANAHKAAADTLYEHRNLFLLEREGELATSPIPSGTTPQSDVIGEICVWLRGLENIRRNVTRISTDPQEVEVMRARQGLYEGVAADIEGKWGRKGEVGR